MNCEQTTCGRRARLNIDGKTCTCNNNYLMNPRGDCFAIPTWAQSIKTCKAEKLGSLQVPVSFEDVPTGFCVSPEFILTRTPFDANGYRYVYIDEIYNSFWFGLDIQNFIAEQGQNAFVINGQVNSDGNYFQDC